MSVVQVKTQFYQQFDADMQGDVPAEGYGGWDHEFLPLDLARSALIVMHAWAPTYEDHPGWMRAAEFLTRSARVVDSHLHALVVSARKAGLPVVHVVAGEGYYEGLAGYQASAALAGEEPPRRATYGTDQTIERLRSFKLQRSHPGTQNLDDVIAGIASLAIHPALQPRKDEFVVATTAQLVAVCESLHLSHLLYTGFALNACLFFEPGGMSDMHRNGFVCSVVQDCVVALESDTSAREEAAKNAAVYQVAVLFGFVYDSPDLIAAFENAPSETDR